MIGDFLCDFQFFFVGTGEPPPYCDKIPTKSPFYMVVVLILKSWDWVFDRKFVSGAPLSEICKGEAVVDLSALEYGPSHQLDLALRPAEDPFLAKKVRVWVGWLEN